MAFTEGDLVEISVKAVNAGITYMNVWQYQVAGTFSGVDAAQVGEGWWNDVKTVYRGVPASTYGNFFTEVLVRELNDPTGEYGTFVIPSAESAGTRTPASETGLLQPYAAIGMKLAVGTRVTRPGSKRFGGLVELDNNAGYANGPVYAATEALGAHMVAAMVLGIPALGMQLDPIICRKDATGAVVAHQPITGYSVSLVLSHQTSRSIGRGA